MFIVLLETSGNQRYIFSTNKLRENVGASELTYQIGTKFIECAVKQIDNRDFSVADILEEEAIEKTTNKIEVILATSGKALLLVKDENNPNKEKNAIAREVVRFITQKALEEMPGLTVHGAICEVEDVDDAGKFHQSVKAVHEQLEKIRYQIPSNLQRFQRLPFAAECNTSNLPAEKLYVHEAVKTVEEKKPHSLVSITKQEALDKGKKRVIEIIRNTEKELYQTENPTLFEFAANNHRLNIEERFKETKWFAVIHADGNGLGQKFLKFQDEIKANSSSDYVEKYRRFSLILDECTLRATTFALKNLQNSYPGGNISDIPVIPLILGGDDLTIICDGQYAIKFTKDFLSKFVEETKKPEIQDIFPNGIELGICAGISIIKPHFPFHQAYGLAEELLQSAKKSKNISTSLSAFDYHVLYDSSGTTLDEIRGKTPFVARPYIVTPKDDALKLVSEDSDEEKWIENHHFDKLEDRVEVMIEPERDDATKRRLPNSQLHVLREGLYVAENTKKTQEEVDARAKLIAHRYETFKHLFADEKAETLFFDAVLFDKNDDEAETKRTHFLDALDIVEFWK